MDPSATSSPHTPPAASTANLNDRTLTAALLENLADGYMLIDPSGNVAWANHAAETIFRFPPDALLGRPFSSLLAEPFSDEYRDALVAFSAGTPGPLVGERRDVVAKSGDERDIDIEITLSEVRAGGAPTTLAAVIRDIRDRKRLEVELRSKADRDALTGLLNRPSFEQAISQHIDYSSRYGNAGSVIALGVDNFRYVNESVGNAAGDELLVQISESIANRLRKTDVLARLEGDVFGVLVHGVDHEQATAVAEELLGLVRRASHVVAREAVSVTMSGGITSLEQRPLSGSELLSEAETALQEAKDRGRDRVVRFDPEGRGEADERKAWSDRVRRATERGLFVLVSQPILDLTRNQTTQHEVLLRMREDGGGLVPPGSFIAAAERFGLMGRVDRWVTQQAMRLVAAHNREGRELLLEVNLSGQTMSDQRFPEEVKRELQATGIDPASIVFEVTETAAVADIDQARLFIKSLTRMGFRFALDDFGAGFASFYYLKHLPISYLKIDGEFVRELPTSKADQLIVKALVDVCQGLGIKTVAEFVSEQPILDAVRALGVDYAQGFLLGKPAPVSELRTAPDGDRTPGSDPVPALDHQPPPSR